MFINVDGDYLNWAIPPASPLTCSIDWLAEMVKDMEGIHKEARVECYQFSGPVNSLLTYEELFVKKKVR